MLIRSSHFSENFLLIRADCQSEAGQQILQYNLWLLGSLFDIGWSRHHRSSVLRILSPELILYDQLETLLGLSSVKAGSS